MILWGPQIPPGGWHWYNGLIEMRGLPLSHLQHPSFFFCPQDSNSCLYDMPALGTADSSTTRHPSCGTPSLAATQTTATNRQIDQTSNSRCNTFFFPSLPFLCISPLCSCLFAFLYGFFPLALICCRYTQGQVRVENDAY